MSRNLKEYSERRRFIILYSAGNVGPQMVSKVAQRSVHLKRVVERGHIE